MIVDQTSKDILRKEIKEGNRIEMRFKFIKKFFKGNVTDTIRKRDMR